MGKKREYEIWFRNVISDCMYDKCSFLILFERLPMVQIQMENESSQSSNEVKHASKNGSIF